MPPSPDFEVSITFPKNINTIHRLANLAVSLDLIELVSIAWTNNDPEILDLWLHYRYAKHPDLYPFPWPSEYLNRLGLGRVTLRSLSINSYPDLTAVGNVNWMAVLQFAFVYGILNYKKSKESLIELHQDGSKLISKLVDSIQGLTEAQKIALEAKVNEFRQWISSNGVEFSHGMEDMFRAIAPRLIEEDEIPNITAKPQDDGNTTKNADEQ